MAEKLRESEWTEHDGPDSFARVNKEISVRLRKRLKELDPDPERRTYLDWDCRGIGWEKDADRYLARIRKEKI